MDPSAFHQRGGRVCPHICQNAMSNSDAVNIQFSVSGNVPVFCVTSCQKRRKKHVKPRQTHVGSLCKNTSKTRRIAL